MDENITRVTLHTTTDIIHDVLALKTSEVNGKIKKSLHIYLPQNGKIFPIAFALSESEHNDAKYLEISQYIKDVIADYNDVKNSDPHLRKPTTFFDGNKFESYFTDTIVHDLEKEAFSVYLQFEDGLQEHTPKEGYLLELEMNSIYALEQMMMTIDAVLMEMAKHAEEYGWGKSVSPTM